MADLGIVGLSIDVAAVEDLLRSGTERVQRIVLRNLDKLGEDLEQWARDHGPKDTTASVESVTHLATVEGDVPTLYVYSDYPVAGWTLETGRGPGGLPPFEKILGWVNRRLATSKQLKGVQAVGRIVGKSHRGGITPPVGKEARKAGLVRSAKNVHTTLHHGRRDGETSMFSSDWSASNPYGDVDRATKQFSNTTRDEVRAAFQIMFSIAKHGTHRRKPKPLLFTRMRAETGFLVDRAIDRMQEEIGRELSK